MSESEEAGSGARGLCEQSMSFAVENVTPVHRAGKDE